MSDDKKEEAKKEESKEEKSNDKKEESQTAEKKTDNTEKKQEKKEKKPEPSGKFKDLIKKIEELSVLELAELVKELEERFGVSAASVAVAGAPVAGGESNGEVKEEKSAFNIHLVDAGAQKIAVIKAVRVILPDLGLKEAKDLVDAAPKEIKKDVPKAEAEEAKKKLEEAGAKVELK